MHGALFVAREDMMKLVGVLVELVVEIYDLAARVSEDGVDPFGDKCPANGL